MRLLVMENENRVSPLDVKQFTNKLATQNYEPLLTVRDNETQVRILLNEKRGKLKKMVILISEPDEFVFLKLRTKIKMKHLNQLMQLINEQQQVPLLPKEAMPPKTEDKPIIRA